MEDYISIINGLLAKLKSDGHSLKEISDTRHTFAHLYKTRMILFAIICAAYPELSFKSKKHFEEESDPMFNDDFIAGIYTPKGLATFHFKLKYWDLFSIKEIDRAPKYDGYSEDEALDRLSSLIDIEKERGKSL